MIFKNSKTGKVDNIQASELAEGVWRRVALGHGLKLLTKNGHVYKYDGFRESVSSPRPLRAGPDLVPGWRLVSCWLVLVLYRAALPASLAALSPPPRTALTPIFLAASLVPGRGAASQSRALGSARLYVVVSNERSLLLAPAQEFDKLSDFFKAHYRLELAEKDLCVKGWNWGTVRFGGESW